MSKKKHRLLREITREWGGSLGRNGYNRCMCGRFALKITPKLIAEMFGLAEVPELQERYNIAPGEAIAAVLNGDSGRRRVLKRLRWGCNLSRRSRTAGKSGSTPRT